MLLSSPETAPKPVELNSSPRISFSSDLTDDRNFITISPNPNRVAKTEQEMEKERARQADFEFLSMGNSRGGNEKMITADELIFDGKLLPFWQVQECEKLGKISLKGKDEAGEVEVELEMDMEEVINNKEEARVWFVDDDPSPRPPKCTVLWKELLKLKKQRASALSPSTSSSSTISMGGDLPPIEEGKEESRAGKHIKRIKKGLERTRSATIRIRPMVNVPICTQGKNNSQLPPFFSLKKGGGRLER